MKLFLLTILLTTFSFSNTTIYISHNNKLSKVSHTELANLYLKKSNTINGIKVIPVDSKNRELFQEFYQKIIQKTPKQLHAYWTKEIYRGTKLPPKRLSSQAVKKAMKKGIPLLTYEKNKKTGHILISIK